MSDSQNWVKIAAISDVDVGSALAVDVAGLNLAVCHLEGGEICVVDNVCTHAYALLTDGWLEGCMLECPLHAGQFDVRTGAGQGAPIEEDLKTFKVRVENGAILVNLPA